MDKKMLTIILAVVLIGCFFLPYMQHPDASGYELMTGLLGKLILGGARYVLLIAPVAALLLLFGALNNGNYPGGRALWSWLPVLGLIVFVVLLYMKASDMAKDMGEKSTGIGDFIKSIGYGYWISLAASLTLVVYNPKAKA